MYVPPEDRDTQPDQSPSTVANTDAYKDLLGLVYAVTAKTGYCTSGPLARARTYHASYRRAVTPRRTTLTRDAYVKLGTGLARSEFYRNPSCGFLPVVQMPGNKNGAIADIGTMESKQIQALRHVRRNGGTCLSRITLTVGEKANLANLYQRLAGYHTKFDCIDSFKVMGPDSFGQGPDDAVLYLSCPLAMAQDLIANLPMDGVIGPMLTECVPQPLGLERFAPGLYGTDIPRLSLEQQKMLAIEQKDLGSHGWLVCSIAAYAAVHCRVDSGLPGDSDYLEYLRMLCKALGLNPDKPTRLQN